MSTTEAASAFATGVGLWVLALATPRPSWAPEPTGWVLTVIGALLIVRAVIGAIGGLRKLISAIRRPAGWPGNRSPRTPAEIEEVRVRRPKGWEYLYFAGLLLVFRAGYEGEYLDHRARIRAPSGDHVSDDDAAADYVHRALDDIQAHVASLGAIMDPEVQERSFGSMGSPGDEVAIEHLARRWTSIYGDLVRWSVGLRSARVTGKYSMLFPLLAGLADQPIEQYRAFVDRFVGEVDRLPAMLRGKAPSMDVHLVLEVSIDQNAMDLLNAEMARIDASTP